MQDLTPLFAKNRGIEQGIEQHQKEVVIKSFNAGLDYQLIQKITGLNQEQVDEIINKNV